MLREMPSRRSKASKRRTPRKQSRNSISVHRSPITATERATEQGSSASSFHFIDSISVLEAIVPLTASRFNTNIVQFSNGAADERGQGRLSGGGRRRRPGLGYRPRVRG